MVLCGTHDSGHNALHRAHKPSSLAYTHQTLKSGIHTTNFKLRVWHTHHTPRLAYTPQIGMAHTPYSELGYRTSVPELRLTGYGHELRFTLLRHTSYGSRTTVHRATAHELRLTDYGPPCYGTRATAHGLRSTTPQHTHPSAPPQPKIKTQINAWFAIARGRAVPASLSSSAQSLATCRSTATCSALRASKHKKRPPLYLNT